MSNDQTLILKDVDGRYFAIERLDLIPIDKPLHIRNPHPSPLNSANVYIGGITGKGGVKWTPGQPIFATVIGVKYGGEVLPPGEAIGVAPHWGDPVDFEE